MSEEVLTSDTQQNGVSKFYYCVAGFNILLESGIKTEIIEKCDIFPIPHTPEWCKGMISLRGKLIPVANLHKLLNDSAPGKSPWLLVLEIAPHPQLAILIDQLPMQQLLSNDNQDAIDNTRFPDWIESSTSIDDKTLYQANHTQLFEQLIHENETSQRDTQTRQATPTQDSSGNDA